MKAVLVSASAVGYLHAAAPAEAPPARAHFWPMIYGPADSPNLSPYTQSRDLKSSFAWNWSAPEGRNAHISNGGILIDDQQNLYAHFDTANGPRVIKFSPDGVIRWTAETGAAVSALDGDHLYGTSGGVFVAVDLETGLVKWSSRIASEGTNDISGMGVGHGVVIGASGTYGGDGGGKTVYGVNATDGRKIWEYLPHNSLWNFIPIYTPGGQSFIFQDQHGGAYHMGIDGRLLWSAGYRGPVKATWTDGGAMLGPNGLVYITHSDLPLMELLNPWAVESTGDIRAYRLSDGAEVWRQGFASPPQSWATVTRLEAGGELLVIQPIGTQPGIPPHGVTWLKLGPFAALRYMLSWHLGEWGLADWRRFLWWNRPLPSSIEVFEAGTGSFRWRWSAPTLLTPMCRGDEEFMYQRGGGLCVPNPWGTPTVDAAKTIFTANQNGMIYALWRTPGGSTEVSEYDAGAAFSLPGPAMAPGLMAIISCDTLFVFKS